MVSSKTYDDVTSEFALGQVAFYPNGVWAYSQIKGNDVADEDLGMLPYYGHQGRGGLRPRRSV